MTLKELYERLGDMDYPDIEEAQVRVSRRMEFGAVVERVEMFESPAGEPIVLLCPAWPEETV